MSFEIVIRALLALVIAVLLVRAARSLRRGRVNVDGAVYLRESEPRIFWTDLALDAVIVLLFGLALASPWSRTTERLIFVAMPLSLVVRFLLTRRKGDGRRDFSQGAGEYLALALLYGLVVLAAIGFMALFLRDL